MVTYDFNVDSRAIHQDGSRERTAYLVSFSTCSSSSVHVAPDPHCGRTFLFLFSRSRNETETRDSAREKTKGAKEAFTGRLTLR